MATTNNFCFFAHRTRHAPHRWSTESHRAGASTPLIFSFPACSTPSRWKRRSRTAHCSRWIRRRRRRCLASRAVLHRGNVGPIFRSTPAPGFDRICLERRPPFEDDIIHYCGQYIALAVADTFETAKAAADAVRATYSREKPNVEHHLEAGSDPDVVFTAYGQWRGCKVAAVTPQPGSRMRPSRSTKLTSRLRKRTILSSCTRLSRCGMATC